MVDSCSPRYMLEEFTKRESRFTAAEIRVFKEAVSVMDRFADQFQRLSDEEEEKEQEILYLRQQNEGLPEHSFGLKVKFKPHTCFLLRPECDSAAVAALRAYADNTNNVNLKYDILIWIGDATEADRPIEQTAEQIIAESIIAGEKLREAEKKNEA